MDRPVRIVVIEDELAIRRFLKASSSPSEVEWFEAGTAAEGTQSVAKHQPDVVLLDLGLPDADGLDVLARLREWTHVPVIVLTARGRETDKINALDAGADDYVTKPFALGELMARVRVAIRHAKARQEDPSPLIEVDGLCFDFEKRLVSVDGAEVRLTPTEYRLLGELVRHAGRVVTQTHLLREVWGEGFEDATHTLRVHMASIRQKIERDPTHPRFLRTETGVGYRFIAE